MNIKRRSFIKGGTAACVLLLPGIASAASYQSAQHTLTSAADLHIEKSIKAGFGGGFSVQNHTQSNGLTYANIEHSGNRYTVASADLLDWQIVGAL